MGCAVTILSHDEAMALPPSERPLNYRLPSDVYHAVFEAVGRTSMFETAEAERVAVNLCLLIASSFEKHGVILADHPLFRVSSVDKPGHVAPPSALTTQSYPGDSQPVATGQDTGRSLPSRHGIGTAPSLTPNTPPNHTQHCRALIPSAVITPLKVSLTPG
jgi:hypothetical protein